MKKYSEKYVKGLRSRIAKLEKDRDSALRAADRESRRAQEQWEALKSIAGLVGCEGAVDEDILCTVQEKVSYSQALCDIIHNLVPDPQSRANVFNNGRPKTALEKLEYLSSTLLQNRDKLIQVLGRDGIHQAGELSDLIDHAIGHIQRLSSNNEQLHKDLQVSKEGNQGASSLIKALTNHEDVDFRY